MSQCVFTGLRSMLAGTILCENKGTKEIGPLGGNWGGRGRLPWNTGIRKFPALITKAKWKREQLKEIQNQKQVEKAGRAMFLARRNIFHFTSPTTHFKCKILSKKRGSSDSTAEGQPVISLPPATDTCQRDTQIPWIGTLHHTTKYSF